MTDRHVTAALTRLGPTARTYVLAAVLGIPVGLLAGVYLWLVRHLRALVWEGHEPRLADWLPFGAALLVTTVLGGLLVGLVRGRHDRDSPHDLDDVLADVDAAVEADQAGGTGPADAARGATAEPGDEREGVAPEPAGGGPKSVPWILRATLLGIVSLTAGASLGPEAPLLALAMGFGGRIALLLRMSSSEAVVISGVGALSGLFGGPLGAAVLSIEDRAATSRAPRLLGPGLVAGVTGFYAMLLVPGGGVPHYALPAITSSPLASLAWSALAAVPAALAAALLLVSVPPSRALAGRIHPVPRAAVGGLVLGLAALVQPLVLFSGEHEAQELIDDLGSWTVGALLVLVALKVVATAASMATGYFGGQIFPGAFLGMAAAALLVALLPGAPGSVVVAAGAGAGTTVVLRRPVASALIMLFFFPLDAALPLLVGAGVGAAVVALLRERLPAPTPIGGGH